MSAGRSATELIDKAEVARSFRNFALLGLLILVSSCVSARPNVCPDIRGVTDLYAMYDIVAVEKYRGGLTSRDQAEALSSREVELSAEQIRMGETTISQPRYEIRCHPAPVEGEVTTDRWSSFYGYGTERPYIEVLDVFAANDMHPSFRFEVIGPQELWRLYDGWLYRLHARVAD
jgi:hypothetical protein